MRDRVGRRLSPSYAVLMSYFTALVFLLVSHLQAGINLSKNECFLKYIQKFSSYVTVNSQLGLLFIIFTNKCTLTHTHTHIY